MISWDGLDLPVDYDKEEFARIQKAAKKIQEDSEVLIVIGIGGSYLGARAAIEFLRHSFYNMRIQRGPQDAGDLFRRQQHQRHDTLKGLIDVLGDRDFSINVISKSGTTTEPAIAFRVFQGDPGEKIWQRRGSQENLLLPQTRQEGALKHLADSEGYETFVVPDDVGGRFSVLTAVGLLPIAVSGADITKLMEGAASRKRALPSATVLKQNDAMKYAAVRNILTSEKARVSRSLANYEPSLHYVSEWWKQLYGESEGKDHKGIYPGIC